jgi:hypothetical protein
LDVMKVRLGPKADGRAGAEASPESTRTVYAFNIVGWGLAADAGARAHWLRSRASWLGSHRYVVANVLEVLRRRIWPARLRLVNGGTEELHEGDLVMALICNTQHTGAGHFIRLGRCLIRRLRR